MVTGADEVARSVQLLTTSLVDAAMRLAVLLIQRRAERLREAARQGEARARHERARVAAHRAADAAIWRRTTDPAFWRRATPERIARAWQAVSTWYQVDPEAAGARHAIAERLRRRGVDLAGDASANPGDAKWLQTALALAEAEREEAIAFVAELDSELPSSFDHILWDEDEVPRPMRPAENPDKVVWNYNELSAEETAAREALVPDTVMWSADEVVRDTSPDLNNASDSRSPSGNLKDTERADDRQPTAEQTTAVGTATQMPSSEKPPAQPVRTTVARDEVWQSAGLSKQDQARMAAMVRQAWPDENAGRVLTDESWPVLARSMLWLERQGKDVHDLLGRLPFDTTDTKLPATLTAWTLRQVATGDLQAQQAKQQRLRHLQRVATLRERHGSREADETGHVAALAEDRIDARTVIRLQAAFPTNVEQALNTQGISMERDGGRRRSGARTEVRDHAERSAAEASR